MGSEKSQVTLGKWLLGAIALLTSGLAHSQTYDAPPPDYATSPPDRAGATEDGDARFRSLFRSWVAVESMAGSNTGAVALPRPLFYNPPVSFLPPAAPPPLPRYGCSESGSCYGEISPATGKPKTVHVPGYFRKDGTYVRGHYKSKSNR